ncbi:MAG TPA: class I SAM-dependent methyltransferase [Blastocatellia bacterium]|nr:class I SAM-dependent methyltransferase [Blastocatellia bacterium]
MIPDQDTNYYRLVAHYESCLARYGDTHLGVDWPNPQDADKRYEVMLGVIRPTGGGSSVKLLDFGCGASHLYGYIRERGLDHIDYAGLELSPRFIELCRAKFPDRTYYHADLLDPRTELPEFDYLVLNGVLTEKRELSFDQMWSYGRRLLRAAWSKTRLGMAFNCMSKQVDWEREDLFHLPLNCLADFLAAELSRHFIVRQDYGLYEYTVYLYRNQVESCLSLEKPSRPTPVPCAPSI